VGKTLVLGGDGRYFNVEAAQVLLEMKQKLTCVRTTFYCACDIFSVAM
jgi:phosphoglucomutase